jgi:AAA domain
MTTDFLDDDLPPIGAGLPNGHDAAPSLVLPDADYVRQRTSLNFWHDRELPPVDPLLGELVTTTSRILLVGPTGLGKTNISMAAGIAIADGADFLHWRGCGRPRSVLYIDGEMSRRLFKVRLDDAVRRHGNRPPTFFAFSREDFEDMPPLDTTVGQKYIDHVIEVIGGVDLIIFDNIQALTIGDLREPESWRKVIPWTRDLTRRCIGQIWVHHTGHNESHGYGDKTREWGLDTVALMEEIERPGADIAFKLKFDKARERTSDNRADFEEAVITLANDEWSSERGEHVRTKKPVAKDRALTLLIDAVARHGTIPPACSYIPPNTPAVTVGVWRKACELGCISEGGEGAARKAFERSAKKLIEQGHVGKHDLFVWPVR